MEARAFRAMRRRLFRGTYADRLVRRFRLARLLRRDATRPGVTVPLLRLLPSVGFWRHIEVRRGWRLTLRLPDLDTDWNGTSHVIYRNHLPVVVHLFSQVTRLGRTAWVNLGDWDRPHLPGNIAFCSNSPDSLLIPDPDFYNSNGYLDLRHELPRQRPWHERQDTIVWRGATTGRGSLPDDTLDLSANDLRPRVRLCATFKSIPGTDVKIYLCAQTPEPKLAEQRLRTLGLFGDKVPREAWLDHKFAFDIDGNANTWSNLFTRMLLGCCVIKVASPRELRQWYYHRLEPWRHYVPVRSDMSDLADKIEWCRGHQAECARIADAGQKLALAMTFETEISDAVRRLSGHMA
jgi:hypothetical protein